jgi:hypothetical protein
VKRLMEVELERAPGHEPCKGVWSVHALYRLGLDDETVQADWPKLAGRRVGLVRNLLADLPNHKRESWQHLISVFAKNTPSERN